MSRAQLSNMLFHPCQEIPVLPRLVPWDCSQKSVTLGFCIGLATKQQEQLRKNKNNRKKTKKVNSTKIGKLCKINKCLLYHNLLDGRKQRIESVQREILNNPRKPVYCDCFACFFSPFCPVTELSRSSS